MPNNNLEERVGVQLGCWKKAIYDFEKVLDKYKDAKLNPFRIGRIIKAGKIASQEELIYEKTIAIDKKKISKYKVDYSEDEHDLQERFRKAINQTEALIGEKANEIDKFRNKILTEHIKNALNNACT